MKLGETTDDAIIKMFAKPNSARFKVILEDGELFVLCTGEPVKGKVNKELVKELSRSFHAKVEIVSGFTSKQKKLLLTGISKREVGQLPNIL